MAEERDCVFEAFRCYKLFNNSEGLASPMVHCLPVLLSHEKCIPSCVVERKFETEGRCKPA